MFDSPFPVQRKRTPFFHRLREWVGETFRQRPQPLTVSQMGKMGRAAQLAEFKSRMDAKHAQLRAEMAGRG